MKTAKDRLTLFLFSSVLCASGAFACSSLYVANSQAKLMGKNYEWPHDHGRLFLNPASLRKKALVKNGVGLVWKSLYPSITFNQIAEHFPHGGMNSEGLAIEVLLGPSNFPRESEKRTINELQWIQYLLDTSKNVREAIFRAKRIDIVPIGNFSVHYHACDKTDHCAVFFYQNGNLQVHESRRGQTSTLRNSRHSMVPRQRDPFPRGFGRVESLSDLANQFNDRADREEKEKEVSRFLSLLRKVSRFAKWQIAYELNNSRVHFNVLSRADRGQTLSLDFKAFHPYDLECHPDRSMPRPYLAQAGLRFDLAQSVLRLKENTKKPLWHPNTQLYRTDFSRKTANESLIEQSKAMFRAAGVNGAMQKQIAEYPENNVRCRRKMGSHFDSHYENLFKVLFQPVRKKLDDR